MKAIRLAPFVAAVGSSMTLAAALPASAADNPFQMIEYGPAVSVAAAAVDMQGNKIEIDEETGFEYGGDQTAGYADGKLGTGAKDPAVCGTFSGSSCSMPHITGGKSAAETVKDEVMNKAQEGLDAVKEKL